jgi:hypothetical protein
LVQWPEIEGFVVGGRNGPVWKYLVDYWALDKRSEDVR